jgi:hypothetical protein
MKGSIKPRSLQEALTLICVIMASLVVIACIVCCFTHDISFNAIILGVLAIVLFAIALKFNIIDLDLRKGKVSLERNGDGEKA